MTMPRRRAVLRLLAWPAGFSMAAHPGAQESTPRVATTPANTGAGPIAGPWLKPVALPSPTPAQLAAIRAAQLARAETALALKPPSVMDKTLLPASGNRHDYQSFGPYWWPDPAKPDGLPYIRRDGQRNPDAARGSDAPGLARLGAAIEALGLAYEATNDERFAGKVAQLARTWFLDPASRMTPNFQHAQAIPGLTPGRGIGLIEARWLIGVNEGLARCRGASTWQAGEQAALHAWMGEFHAWLRTSRNGRDEEAEHNNHGSWYDALAAHLGLATGRRDDARALLQQGLARRLATHIAPDGRQPHELARTRPLEYSIFNLEALLLCAQLAEQVGVDWWGFESTDGRSLRGALAYLAPYVAKPDQPWPTREVTPADRRRLLPLLAAWLQRRDDPALRAALEAGVTRWPPAAAFGRMLPAIDANGESAS